MFIKFVRSLPFATALIGGAAMSAATGDPALAAGGSTISSILGNLWANMVWQDEPTTPDKIHPNHDIARLVGDAIAGVLYRCAKSNTTYRSLFERMGATAATQYLNIANHKTLKAVSSETIPEIFAAAAGDDMQTVKLLDEVVESDGLKQTVAWHVVRFIYSETSDAPPIDDALQIAENAVINGLFSEIKERFKRDFAGEGRAYAALSIEMGSRTLKLLDEFSKDHQSILNQQNEQSRAIEGIRSYLKNRIDNQIKNLESIIKTGLHLLTERTGKLSENLNEVLLQTWLVRDKLEDIDTKDESHHRTTQKMLETMSYKLLLYDGPQNMQFMSNAIKNLIVEPIDKLAAVQAMVAGRAKLLLADTIEQVRTEADDIPQHSRIELVASLSATLPDYHWDDTKVLLAKLPGGLRSHCLLAIAAMSGHEQTIKAFKDDEVRTEDNFKGRVHATLNVAEGMSCFLVALDNMSRGNPEYIVPAKLYEAIETLTIWIKSKYADGFMHRDDHFRNFLTAYTLRVAAEASTRLRLQDSAKKQIDEIAIIAESNIPEEEQDKMRRKLSELYGRLNINKCPHLQPLLCSFLYKPHILNGIKDHELETAVNNALGLVVDVRMPANQGGEYWVDNAGWRGWRVYLACFGQDGKDYVRQLMKRAYDILLPATSG